MRRREFIRLVGCAAVAWPVAARAAGGNACHRISRHFVARDDPTLWRRFPSKPDDRLPVMAADLVRRQVTAI